MGAAKSVKDVDTNGDNTGDPKGTLGFDCLQIPAGAVGTMCTPFSADRLNANVFCGNSGGLATNMNGGMLDGTNTGTICTKQDPFSLQFLTDWFEAEVETGVDLAANNAQA